MSPSRRAFLKSAAISLASLPLFGRLMFAPAARAARAADAELPMLKESDELAQFQKFCLNADKPTRNCAARRTKEKAKQYCYNCQLFTRLDGDKKAGRGKCMIMLKNRVPAGAWCASWVQNPAVPD